MHAVGSSSAATPEALVRPYQPRGTRKPPPRTEPCGFCDTRTGWQLEGVPVCMGCATILGEHTGIVAEGQETLARERQAHT